MHQPAKPPTSGKKTLANSLVALSSAAVIAVYAAGYARTAPVAGQYNSAPGATASTGANVVPSATATPAPIATSTTPAPATGFSGPNGASGQRGNRQPGSGAIPAAPATATATVAAAAPAPAGSTSAPAATSGAYRDGTYNGTGTSRHGNISVAVTVQSGRIVSAEVTDCATRYPCTLVAELPGQVVARQGATVDTVTGATDSTNAYRAAVNAALAQAR